MTLPIKFFVNNSDCPNSKSINYSNRVHRRIAVCTTRVQKDSLLLERERERGRDREQNTLMTRFSQTELELAQSKFTKLCAK